MVFLLASPISFCRDGKLLFLFMDVFGIGMVVSF